MEGDGSARGACYSRPRRLPPKLWTCCGCLLGMTELVAAELWHPRGWRDDQLIVMCVDNAALDRHASRCFGTEC